MEKPDRTREIIREGTPVIRYSQLQNFVEIVEQGSFSAAAKSLYLSQSALSQSVAGLEEDLGVELIHRSKSGVRLTYFGHRFYEQAKDVLGAFRGFETDLRSLLSERNSLSGQVRIECTPGAKEYLSQTVVPELSASYPGVELLVLPPSDMGDFGTFVKSGCSFGIGACLSEAWEPVRTQAEAAGLVCEFFSSETPMVLLSARNPLAAGNALSREQLAQLKLVCYSSNPSPRYLSLFHGTATRAPNKEAVVRLVADSDYAGVFAPSGIRRELSELRGRLKLLPLDFEDESVQPVVHYLIHAPEGELQRAEQCILDLLRCYPYTG